MQARLGMCRLHISDDWFCLDPGIMISMTTHILHVTSVMQCVLPCNYPKRCIQRVFWPEQNLLLKSTARGISVTICCRINPPLDGLLKVTYLKFTCT